MERKKKSVLELVLGLLFVGLFCLFTFLVTKIDVLPIGPDGSEVGFATINGAFSNAIGFNDICYKLSEVLGYLALVVVGFFGCLGLYQLIKRKSLLKIDREIYILAGLYVVTLALYVLFEKVVINYRPVILDAAEGLEASFPSSHTMLGMVVMFSAVEEIKRLITDSAKKNILVVASIVIGGLIVLLRVLSGAHWLSDIFASIIISTGLLLLFNAFINFANGEKKN